MIKRMYIIGVCWALVWQVSGTPAAEMLFTHMADASAAEWLGDDKIVVGDDEDNILRVYDIARGGAPVATWDLTPYMALTGKSPEMDIEGSARIGDVIYWITSHAPNKSGKARPNRKRFFATHVVMRDGMPVFKVQGRPVTGLLESLGRDPRYSALKLLAAARLPPKTPGSLNIEALCDQPDGTLLLGFRSPLPGGKALLAPLLNPAAVINGTAPHWGAPIYLDLGGNGIRAMNRLGDDYLIAAGSALSGGQPRFYRWDGKAALSLLPEMTQNLPDNITPEAMIPIPGTTPQEILILSDDGALVVDGIKAKALPEAEQRTFRGIVRQLK